MAFAYIAIDPLRSAFFHVNIAVAMDSSEDLQVLDPTSHNSWRDRAFLRACREHIFSLSQLFRCVSDPGSPVG